MTFIFSLLTIGGWIFWLSVASLVVVTCVAEDNRNYSFTYTASTVFLLLFGFQLFQYLKVYTITTILIIAACYFLIGAIWSFFKWWLHCGRTVDKVRQIASVREGNNISELEQAEFTRMITPSRNKSLICGWITHWPISIAWSGLHDFVHGIFNALRNVYVRIAARHLENIRAIGVIPRNSR